MNCFDFQVHSKFSFDSLNDFDKIKKRGKQMGLDCVVITDHDTIKGGIVSTKHSDENFLFIAGQEIKTEFGDIIGLMIRENINSSIFLEVIDEIKSQQGIVYLPHPSRKMQLSNRQILDNIDVIEAVNGRCNKDENMFSSKLAITLDLPYAAGSDAHTLREVGQVQTVFSKNIEDEDELRKVLVDKTVKRKILGSGSYNILNHLQSSLTGTVKTGKIKQFAEGITRKIIK